MIHTSPLGFHKTMEDYANFLIKRYILPQLKTSVREVHIIFNTPGRLPNTPKCFEQQRRDKNANVSNQHHCDKIEAKTKIPKGKWIESCDVCKRFLILFLGKYFLNKIQPRLAPNHKLYVAGAFEDDLIDSTWYVQGCNKAQPDPRYFCTAEESDTCIWLHVKQTTSMSTLVMSPDTDVYHIGCPLQSASSPKHVVLQINKLSARYLDLNALKLTLQNDSDLSHFESATLPRVLQTLYISTGCDYISFFTKIGKSTCLRYFFQYASFITSGNNQQTPGTLSDVGLTDNSYLKFYLSFIRLIGTAYFKLHSTGLKTPST